MVSLECQREDLELGFHSSSERLKAASASRHVSFIHWIIGKNHFRFARFLKPSHFAAPPAFSSSHHSAFQPSPPQRPHREEDEQLGSSPKNFRYPYYPRGDFGKTSRGGSERTPRASRRLHRRRFFGSALPAPLRGTGFALLASRELNCNYRLSG